MYVASCCASGPGSSDPFLGAADKNLPLQLIRSQLDREGKVPLGRRGVGREIDDLKADASGAELFDLDKGIGHIAIGPVRIQDDQDIAAAQTAQGALV